MRGRIVLSVALRLLEFPLCAFVVLTLFDFISLVRLIHRYILVTSGAASVFQ